MLFRDADLPHTWSVYLDYSSRHGNTYVPAGTPLRLANRVLAPLGAVTSGYGGFTEDGVQKHYVRWHNVNIARPYDFVNGAKVHVDKVPVRIGV